MPSNTAKSKNNITSLAIHNDLTEFELNHLPPRSTFRNTTYINNNSVSPSPEAQIVKATCASLCSSEFTCPICLSFLKDTLVAKECLHRFCRECIDTSLRKGKRECPTCRTPLISKRSCVADTQLDALINALYGRTVDELREDDRISAVTACDEYKKKYIHMDQHSRREAFIASIKSPQQHDAQKRHHYHTATSKKKQRTAGRNNIDDLLAFDIAHSGDFEEQIIPKLIQVVLFPHPHHTTTSATEDTPLLHLENPYLRLNHTMPIHTLKKFLMTRIRIISKDDDKNTSVAKVFNKNKNIKAKQVEIRSFSEKYPQGIALDDDVTIGDCIHHKLKPLRHNVVNGSKEIYYFSFRLLMVDETDSGGKLINE